jgi:Lar family restriction alleviation protein
MSELKPCPFCGNAELYMDSMGTWSVNCKCSAVGPNEDTKERAVEAWNRRRAAEGGEG